MNFEGIWEHDFEPEVPSNDYQYNGKELEKDLGLNWSFYGFRMYDATIGRFTGVDPIADQFAFVSTYNYAENNPVVGIDLHGLQFVPFWDFNPFLWWERKKAQWQNQFNSGLNEMHQGATKSNPIINNAPISQKSKDFIHKAQTNAGLIKSIQPNLEVISSLAKLHPFGAAGFGMLNGFSEADKGNYGAAALSFFFVPFDMVSGGKASAAKNGSKTLFRAIGTAELTNIIEKRGLDFAYGGVEVKYLTEGLEDAIQQGIRGPDKDNFLIISFDVPEDVYNQLFKSADIDKAFMKGNTVVIQDREQLNLVNKSIDGINVIGKN